MLGETVGQGWLVAVVPVLISTTGAIVSVLISRRAARIERLSAAEDLATRFREPLLFAVFNLETRIYNIVHLDFFGRFLGEDSTDSEREYAILNTMYVFAQFFCWVEILRREAQFVDPRNDRTNRVYAAKIEAVYDTIADSINIQERCFRLFRGEQRALGEVMLVPAEASKPGFPRWGCMTYPSFVQSLGDDEQMARWFRRLREDIDEIRKDVAKRDQRLRLIHHRLMDIVDVLDPDAWRIPSRVRERLPIPPC
jgi:hypothetical protein